MEYELEDAWELAGRRLPDPEWQIEGLIPHSSDGGVRLLVTGVPKVGKSRLLFDLLYGMNYIDKSEWGFGKVIRYSPIVLINEENTLPYLRRRMIQLIELSGAGEEVTDQEYLTDWYEHPVWFPEPHKVISQPFKMLVRQGINLNKPEDIDALIEVVRGVQSTAAERQHSDGKAWLVFDTIGKVAPTIDWNSYTDVHVIMNTVNALQEELNCNIALVHHSNKGDGTGDAKILGSQAIAGWYDAHINLAYKSKKDGWILTHADFREHEEADSFYLTFDDEWVRHTDKPKGDTETKVRNHVLEQMWTLDAMANRTAVARLVKKDLELDITVKTISKYIKNLLDELQEEA